MLDLCDSSGLLLRRDAVEQGCDDDALRRLVLAGLLTRIRQGAYCVASVWSSASPAQRHLLQAEAVLKQYDDAVAISHMTAALWWRAPLVGTDPEDVHLTSLAGRRSRRQAGVSRHRGAMLAGDVTRCSHGWITDPTRTALDVARSEPRDTAVCVIDDLLHRGLTSLEALAPRLEGMRSWPGALHAYHVLSLVDPASESPGETLCRLMFRDLGLPRPVAQLEIHGPLGRLLGRVDFAWPQWGVIVEFDGRSKYQKHRRSGESLEDAILREKRREDAIREATGWIVIRLTWADLHHPERTLARLMGLTRRAA